MLDTRDYMRRPEEHSFGRAPLFGFPCTIILLALYLAVFLAERLVDHYLPGNHFFNSHQEWMPGGLVLIPGYLPLSADGILSGQAWQLLTYQFMHAGWLHLFFNGWAIFMFGREMESHLGRVNFLFLILLSGVAGGLCQVGVALVWPHYFGGPVVGASACAFGLVAAYAAMFPGRELTMLLFLVIPVHFKARTLLIVSGVIALIGFGWHFDRVAHAAHLGGMAMGWLFVREILRTRWMNFRVQADPAAGPRAERNMDDAITEKVDLILEKIAAQGIGSLTPRERKVLEDAARRKAEKE